MERISEKATKEIRYILEGVRDGELKHEQSTYHCGTGHCIAGWKEVLDFARQKSRKGFFTVPKKFINAEYVNEFDRSTDIGKELNSFVAEREENTLFSNYSYGYAQKEWNLNNEEAVQLFHADARLKNQFSVLKKLESGKRLIDGNWKRV